MRWLPIVVFLLAAVAMMPRALAGQRAYTPIDVTARSSPMRDQAVRPEIVNPVQNDVPEAQAVLAGFWRDLRSGQFQFWSHNTGAGVPTGALPFNALTAPMSLPYLVAPRWYAPGLRALAWFLVAQWGLYLLARRIGIGVAAATVAGVAFAFSGAEMIMVFRIGAAAVGPWVLWAVCGIVQRPSARRVAALAAVVAWSWLEGFPAATLFTIYVALAWGAWLLFSERPRRDEADGSAAGGTLVRWVVGRGAAIGAGTALGGLLVAFQALPLSAVINDSGLLETRRFDGTFAMGPYALFGQIDNAVIGGLHGPWVSVANSFEGIGFTGSIALAGAAAALVLATLGRLRAPRRVQRNVGFFGLAIAGMAVLCYSGGRLLDLAYALPGMRSNTIYRHRWFIPLFTALLLAVTLDHLWRDRPDAEALDGDAARVPPARSDRVVAALGTLAGVVVVARAVPTFLDGVHTFGTARPIAVSFVRAAVFVVAATLLAGGRGRFWRGGRIPPTAVVAALLTLVVHTQLNGGMHGWIPQAPVAPYFSTSELTADLRRLSAGKWRFTGTNEYTPYLNSAIVDGLLDVRTTPVLDDQYRTLLASGNLTPFAADKLKTTFDPATFDIRDRSLDELSVRYVVVGTDEGPLGDADPQPTPDRWVPIAESTSLGPVTAGGGVAGVGLALRLGQPVGSPRTSCTGFVRITLVADGRDIGSARRPVWDLNGRPAGADLTVAVTGGGTVALDAPVNVRASVEDGSCPVEVGAVGSTVAARLFYLPADGAWKVAATRQAWVYERRAAKPLVRIDGGTVASFALVPNGVTATVEATAAGTVVVAENDDRGWRATVDGTPAALTSVDGALLGVPVGPGRHEVRLHYLPYGWYRGLAASVLGVLVLAGCVAADPVRARRRRSARPGDRPTSNVSR